MFQESFPLTDKTCFLYGNPQPSHLLIQPVGAQDLSGGLEKEVACLKKMAGEDFLLAAFDIRNWNQELSPWEEMCIRDSAAAKGYSEASGIPFALAFHKNSYVGRTFIKPTQKERESAVRVKLNVIEPVVRGKRIVLVDDSIAVSYTHLAY